MQRKVTKAIFPVAGLGTRFLPATKSIPKEIMTLVDRPLIQYAIDEARDREFWELNNPADVARIEQMMQRMGLA